MPISVQSPDLHSLFEPQEVPSALLAAAQFPFEHIPVLQEVLKEEHSESEVHEGTVTHDPDEQYCITPHFVPVPEHVPHPLVDCIAEPHVTEDAVGQTGPFVPIAVCEVSVHPEPEVTVLVCVNDVPEQTVFSKGVHEEYIHPPGD